MTKKSILRNLQNLRNDRERARRKVSTATLQKINNVIDLFEDRKIAQYTTADKLIKGLSASNGRAKAKGVREYEKAIEKAEAKEPVSEKQEKALEKARRTRQVNRASDDDKRKLGKVSDISKGAFKNRKNYSIKYMLFTTQPMGQTGGFTLNGLKYSPLFVRPAVRVANVKANEFIETIVKRKITKRFDKPLYRRVMMIMRSDTEFQRTMESGVYEYVDAIRIESIEDVSDVGARDMDIREERLRDGSNMSIYHRYIETEIDGEYHTIKEALQNRMYREDECWINALNDHYEGSELMRQKRGKLAKTLNREKVLELMNMTEEEFVEKGASINQMEVVFKHFNIPARLYNFCNQLIFSYDPPKNSTNVRNKNFTALVKNNHIYTINFDLNSLSKKADVETFEFNISQNYYISDLEKPLKYKAFDNVDELLMMTEEDKYNLIQIDNDMAKVLHQLKSARYEPYVKYQVGMISEIKVRFRFKKLKKTIHYNIVAQNLSKQTVHSEVLASNEEMYNRMTEEMFNFNKAMFKENHKSKYSEVDVKILDECRTIVPAGYFNDDVKMKHLREVDENKAFTNAGNKIKEIPVFNEFDIWKKYNGRNINELHCLTLYLVEVDRGNVFFNKKFNLVYGKFLMKLLKKNVDIKIHYYKQPSKIMKVNYKKIIDALWKAKISEDEIIDKQCKKTIANINFGLLEKSSNKGQISKIFNSLREACYYQHLCGGKIYAISQEEEELMEDDTGAYIETKDVGNTYYILNVSDSKKLLNGFRYVKELLLQYHNYTMYEAFETMKENNVRVYSVKSDAFTIHIDDLDKVEGYKFLQKWQKGCMDVGTAIGQWKIQEGKTINFPADEYKFKFNELIEIPELKNENIFIEDEWDRESICKKILAVNEPVIIKAKYAGCGKSAIGEYFSKMNFNVLFVVNNNRQLEEKRGEGLEATTFNKFFSIAVSEDEGNGKLPPFDYSMYDVIVFDEVFMVNLYIKNRIRLFCLNNPDKIRILTGDTKQLPCFEEHTDCQNEEEYANHCVDVICPYNIYLTICKRVGAKDTEEGDRNRKLISDIYDDFWVYKLPLKDIPPKYCEITDDIMASEHNLAYRNIRCRTVSTEIRNRLGKKDKYEVGEILIARKWVRNPRININIRYCIKKISDGMLTLQNISDEEDVNILNEEKVDDIFIYSYCTTTHSSQGSSIKENMTIHEWDLPYVSREWLYTALTRCVDFKNVKFYRNKDFDKEMEMNMYRRYFENKIEGYKNQDRKNQLEIDEDNYVDVQWCMDRMTSNCQKCNTWFDFNIKNGRLNSDFTAQRLDNELCHSKSNCTHYCWYCNCSSR